MELFAVIMWNLLLIVQMVKKEMKLEPDWHTTLATTFFFVLHLWIDYLG
jgi:hypothetical protein